MNDEAGSGSVTSDHHFLLRRLHSLAGIMPIGVFLLFHLTTNASVVWGLMSPGEFDGVHAGAATFQHEVNFIHSMPFLLLIEIFGLWLPIAFHAILGVYYAKSSNPNIRRYSFQSNWRYTLQRTSGYIGVLFIFYHVATLRWGWTFLIPGGTKWETVYASSTLAQVMQGGADGLTTAGILVSLGYMIGVSMLVFHMANGLWTAAITWGLTTSATAQKKWGFVCTGLGAMLMVMAWSAVIGFATLDPIEAKAADEHVNSPHQVDSAPFETASIHLAEEGQ